MSKYLKLLVIVEEDYKPITGEVKFINDTWHCENTVSIKLDDDFVPVPPEEVVKAEFFSFLGLVLDLAKERSNE
jgi:hypothetical protein